MREAGRGPWGRGGFDNELETNFISMQACCLSRRAQTEFPGRPGRVGGRGGRGGVGVTEGTGHCAILGPSDQQISGSQPWKPAPKELSLL